MGAELRGLCKWATLTFRTEPIAQTSSLLKLPKEIRNMIFLLVVREDKKIRLDIINPKPRTNHSIKFFNSLVKKFQVPAIAHVCKETRADSLLQFYYSNNFVLVGDHSCRYYWHEGNVSLLYKIFKQILDTPEVGQAAIFAIGVFEFLIVRWNTLNPVFGRVFLTHPGYEDKTFTFSKCRGTLSYSSRKHRPEGWNISEEERPLREDDFWIWSKDSESYRTDRYGEICKRNGFMMWNDDVTDDFVRGKKFNLATHYSWNGLLRGSTPPAYESAAHLHFEEGQDWDAYKALVVEREAILKRDVWWDLRPPQEKVSGVEEESKDETQETSTT